MAGRDARAASFGGGLSASGSSGASDSSGGGSSGPLSRMFPTRRAGGGAAGAAGAAGVPAWPLFAPDRGAAALAPEEVLKPAVVEEEVDDDDETEVVASSSLKAGGPPRYTKLEVMPSGAIRDLLSFYHAWVVFAVLVGVVMIAYPYARMREQQPVPIPIPLSVSGFVSLAQFREGVAAVATFERYVYLEDQAKIAAEEAKAAAAAPANGSAPAVRVPLHLQGYVREVGGRLDGLGAFLARRGMYHCYTGAYCGLCTGRLVAFDVMERARAAYAVTVDLGVVNNAYLAMTGSDGRVYDAPPFRPAFCDELGVVRQAGSREEACEQRLANGLSCTDDPVAADQGAAPTTLLPPPPRSPVNDVDADWDNYRDELIEWYLETGRGPDGINPAAYVTSKTLFNFTDRYIIVVFTLSVVMSVVAAIMAIIYGVRIVRLGRERVTHEQIWVVVLLVLAALYWSAPEALDRMDRALTAIRSQNSTEPQENFLPEWFDKLRLTSTAVREPAMSGILFFYTWANLHTYRILNPTAHLSFVAFYAPKLGIIFPYVLFKALAHPTLQMYMSEVPFFSALAWLRHFNRFRVWNALRAEVLYTVGALLMELALVVVLIGELRFTTKELRKAKYVRYRTKQIGFRFFAYVTFIFLSVFALVHLMSLLAVPSSLYYPGLANVGPLRLIWLKDTEFHQISPSLLLAGYAVIMAYVNLPMEAVGFFKGWFVNTKLAPSFSRWSRSTRDSVPASQSVFDDEDDAESHLLDVPSEKRGLATDPATSESRLLAGGAGGKPPRQDSMGLPSASATSSVGGPVRPFNSLTSVDRRMDASSGDTSLAMDVSDTEGSDVYRSGPTSSSPPQSKGLPRFEVDHDRELTQEIAEPVRYKKREDSEHLELRANSFVMETHVLMFNFAWYVYYYGTPKVKKVDAQDQSRFKVFKNIRHKPTDTAVLVVDGIDRIVVSFKGTTSMKNMKMSMQAYFERLQNVVPTDTGDGVNEYDRLNGLFGKAYRDAKVHKGFALAYRTVAPRVMSAVQELLAKQRRPVFLTGHSLGGALATLCSLDLWIKLGLSRREILVSTFGSPRVGNDSFRHIYKSTVPLHWRIVVVPDMITKLPKGGYKHVGKKVTLTPYGRMLIDPNLLEQLSWNSNSAGFAYHRKASYMLAMQAWCESNHGKSFIPEFWHFPTTMEDKRRFPAFKDSEESASHVSQSNASVRSRIIELDAMVDALGTNDDDEDADKDILELWGRLARRSLLDEHLQKKTRTVP